MSAISFSMSSLLGTCDAVMAAEADITYSSHHHFSAIDVAQNLSYNLGYSDSRRTHAAPCTLLFVHSQP